MKAIVFFSFVFFSLHINAQTCLDSFHIKGYFIWPIEGSNYQKNQKWVTNYHFSDHTRYCYFLPCDSITNEKSWQYWLINHDLMELNNFSRSDQWIIEKRIREICGVEFKVSSTSFSSRNKVEYEVTEQNKEVKYVVAYVDAYWTKVLITGQERNLVSGGCCSHLIKKREDYDLYILTRLNSSSDSVIIEEKGIQRIN